MYLFFVCVLNCLVVIVFILFINIIVGVFFLVSLNIFFIIRGFSFRYFWINSELIIFMKVVIIKISLN